MGKFYETSEFKKTLRAWYEKLQTSGFQDCERKGWLKHTAIYPFRHHQTQAVREARLNYYLFLSCGLSTEIFKSPRDQRVMEMRAEGAKIKDIVRGLNQDGHRVHRQTVRYIIRRYETKWKIREWRKDQMSSNRAIR